MDKYPDEDPTTEDYARLRGLMSQLALPALTTRGGQPRKREFEVEVTKDTWAVIDSVIVESHRVLFKVKGSLPARFYEFRRSEGVPRWRPVVELTVVSP